LTECRSRACSKLVNRSHGPVYGPKTATVTAPLGENLDAFCCICCRVRVVRKGAVDAVVLGFVRDGERKNFLLTQIGKTFHGIAQMARGSISGLMRPFERTSLHTRRPCSGGFQRLACQSSLGRVVWYSRALLEHFAQTCLDFPVFDSSAYFLQRCCKG
jgi:hypothetical protein